MHRAILFLGIFSVLAGSVLADPCLLIYPNDRTVFHYDVSRYALITEEHPGYDQDYALIGNVLWDIQRNRIASEVYQAPLLEGFAESYSGKSEYYAPRRRSGIVIDGYYSVPRKLNDIYLRFLPFPRDALTQIHINGALLTEPYYRVPELLVTTPVGDGFYSDKITLLIEWTGAKSILISAFSDKNGNKTFDGEPCYNILMEDPSVPVAETTWGQIKSLYRD